MQIPSPQLFSKNMMIRHEGTIVMYCVLLVLIRLTKVATVIAFSMLRHYDGINVDINYSSDPVTQLMTVDQENTSLLAELKEKFRI